MLVAVDETDALGEAVEDTDAVPEAEAVNELLPEPVAEGLPLEVPEALTKRCASGDCTFHIAT